MALMRRLQGYPGHPSHPPLTDVSIGAYTIATALLVLGAAGLEEPAMAHGALLAISAGLLLAATAVFAVSWFPGQAGYQDGHIHAAALVLVLAGEALLLAGGYLGGVLVYVYGHRVLSQPQAPVGQALLPGRLSPRPQAAEPAPIESRQHAVPRMDIKGARPKTSSVERS